MSLRPPLCIPTFALDRKRFPSSIGPLFRFGKYWLKKQPPFPLFGLRWKLVSLFCVYSRDNKGLINGGPRTQPRGRRHVSPRRRRPWVPVFSYFSPRKGHYENFIPSQWSLDGKHVGCSGDWVVHNYMFPPTPRLCYPFSPPFSSFASFFAFSMPSHCDIFFALSAILLCHSVNRCPVRRNASVHSSLLLFSLPFVSAVSSLTHTHSLSPIIFISFSFPKFILVSLS